MVNVKLVQNYINGLDTEPYDIGELENTPEFMKYVMKVSRDKKMYAFCSDDVRCDYEFVRSVIADFSSDFEFVKTVAENYLNSLELNERESEENYSEFINRVRSMEINFLISSMKGEPNRFTIGAALAYAKEREKIRLILDYNKDEFHDVLGLGFIFILEQYGTSKVITDFFAKRMINEEFYCSLEDGENLERFIHRRCRSFDEIKNMGINNFIINTISGMDTSLGEYVMTNPKLIEDLKKDIMGVGVRWDGYMERLNDYRVRALVDGVLRYLESSSDIVSADPDALIKYTAVRLGRDDEFKKRLSDYPDKIDASLLNEENDLGLYRAITYTYKLGKELFSVDVIGGERDDYDLEDTLPKAEIINFPGVK